MIETPDERVIEFCDNFNSISGSTVSEVTNKFGQPTEIEKETHISPHDETYINNQLVLHYQDGYISIYEVPNDNRSYLYAAKYTLKFMPHELSGVIGQTTNSLKNSLGQPDKESKSSITYLCSYESHDSLVFEVNNNQVASIVLSTWLD